MDNKYTIIGIFCIALAIGLGIQSVRDQEKLAQYQQDHPELYPAAATAGNTTIGNATAQTTGNTVASSPAAVTSNAASPAVATAAPAAAIPATPAALAHLQNDDIDVTFTEDGGAIQSVELKKYSAKLTGPERVMFNAGAPRAALSLSVPVPVKPGYTTNTYWSWSGRSATSVIGDPGMPPVPLLGRFTLDKSATNATSVTFRGVTADDLDLVRTYTLGSGSDDTYLIHTTTSITNHGPKPVSLERLFVNAGMAPAPAPGVSSLAQTYLNFGYYDGASANFVTVSEFMDHPARLLGLFPAHPKEKDYVYSERDSADLRWVSVKDFFFTTVLMPEGISGKGFYVQGVPVKVDNTDQTTVTGDLELDLGVLAPGKEKKLELSYYAGPKDYVRLDGLGEHQDLNMQFYSWFSGFCKILLLALIAIHKFIAPISPAWAWGWTIIVFSVIIKGMTWPLTAIQVRSGRRMAKLAAPMKALKEKYADNPQKYQAEVIDLYRQHKINPAAGCLPLLITFPIFIAFNSVLRTAAEMRFAGFFWIHDLSSPDTIAHIASLPVNILPLLMAATTMLQMRIMPSPTTDTSQRTMMQLMPLMMLSFFYTMPSGMILYWTCNNLFTIVQQWLNKRQKDFDPADAKPAPVTAFDRPKAKRR
jgi:YidC/Oxa1 family membrane protein insertase